MKRYELKEIVKKLSSYKYIKESRRVDNNTIEIILDKNTSYFFDMTRGHSFIYKRLSKKPIQSYKAPFDNILHSSVAYSEIISVEVPNNDRIIRFLLAPKSSYKEKLISLQFEFTGKNTNAILIDSDEVIIEALRHIDISRSFRVVRPSVRLLPLPPYDGKIENIQEIDDIDKVLI
ncbi:MAG: NFACT family protein, partial [Sulfurovum sp.]|nr:NFACT family protein [Sulfurovaceae bacterium]